MSERICFVIGAKTKDELLFINELESVCSKTNLTITTDDGTFGIKCFATQPLEELTNKEKYDMIYTCGPELMMCKVFELAQKRQIPIEASLERLMRCAMGLCGSCMIGKYRVCHDGPIFTTKQLSEIKDELGQSRLNLTGSTDKT
ncbi:MAG: hypothetical protein GX638_13255 [Crenarchaeota archaeon]|nr:hypothetical protein [Thermoproteota archaeon]